MAPAQQDHARASRLKQIANFTNSTAGLDLTLRLIQSVTILVSEIHPNSATVKMCAAATMQLTLGKFILNDQISRSLQPKMMLMDLIEQTRFF